MSAQIMMCSEAWKTTWTTMITISQNCYKFENELLELMGLPTPMRFVYLNGHTLKDKSCARMLL